MLNSGHKVQEVAEYLHVHRSTIYREMKRENIPTEIVTTPRKQGIVAIWGQKNHDWNAQGKGRNIKIGNDRPLGGIYRGGENNRR